MGEVSPKLRKYGSADGYTGEGYVHWCPACNEAHAFAVGKPFKSGAQWTFNGDVERPTFTPSMNIISNPRGHKNHQPNQSTEVCHYFLRDGTIQYLGDCTHALRGQTVPLPDLPRFLRD
jgi:Family of unknown function (DUF6527)